MISSKQSGGKNGTHGIMNGPDYISCLMYSDAKDGDYSAQYSEANGQK
ncbi:MAG: hypothetical protein E6230_28635 [Paenibacillus dendritiformis]|nr:hypothetical protein [Paenibacillus dendritiformis]MDU5146118.1 hypothetical protein [Paenibacillus dendritiformis]GIO74329.1 hypothetical protein J27TS7_38430 [Paenibacillus dendritiformis]